MKIVLNLIIVQLVMRKFHKANIQEKIFENAIQLLLCNMILDKENEEQDEYTQYNSQIMRQISLQIFLKIKYMRHHKEDIHQFSKLYKYQLQSRLLFNEKVFDASLIQYLANAHRNQTSLEDFITILNENFLIWSQYLQENFNDLSQEKLTQRSLSSEFNVVNWSCQYALNSQENILEADVIKQDENKIESISIYQYLGENFSSRQISVEGSLEKYTSTTNRLVSQCVEILLINEHYQVAENLKIKLNDFHSYNILDFQQEGRIKAILIDPKMQSFNRIRYDKMTLYSLTQNLERLTDASYRYSFWVNINKMLAFDELTVDEYLFIVQRQIIFENEPQIIKFILKTTNHLINSKVDQTIKLTYKKQLYSAILKIVQSELTNDLTRFYFLKYLPLFATINSDIEILKTWLLDNYIQVNNDDELAQVVDINSEKPSIRYQINERLREKFMIALCSFPSENPEDEEVDNLAIFDKVFSDLLDKQSTQDFKMICQLQSPDFPNKIQVLDIITEVQDQNTKTGEDQISVSIAQKVVLIRNFYNYLDDSRVRYFMDRFYESSQQVYDNYPRNYYECYKQHLIEREYSYCYFL
eukprot:403371556